MPAPSSGSLLRSVFGILLGAIAFGVLKGIVEAWAHGNLHMDAANQAMSTLIILVCDFVSAVAGGYLCTFIARNARAATILAVIFLLMGLAYQQSPSSPDQASWYRLALLLVGPLGVYTGGWLRGV